MKKILLLLALVSYTCNAQVNDAGIEVVDDNSFTDMAVSRTIPYQTLKGYVVNDPAILTGKALIITSESGFEKLFSLKKKESIETYLKNHVDFNTQYVVVVSPKGEYKFKKYKIEDVFYNNTNQIIIKTSGTASDYQTHVEKLSVASDGSKKIVTEKKGKPYAKATEKRPYFLIAISKANKGKVVLNEFMLIKTSSTWEGTKAELKEYKQLLKDGKL